MPDPEAVVVRELLGPAEALPAVVPPPIKPGEEAPVDLLPPFPPFPLPLADLTEGGREGDELERRDLALDFEDEANDEVDAVLLS